MRPRMSTSPCAVPACRPGLARLCARRNRSCARSALVLRGQRYRSRIGAGQRRISIALTLSVFVEELYYLAVSTRRDLGVGLAPETVNAFGNCNELMLDAFGAEFLIHLDRERVWHIRVFGAMDKQSRW